MKIVTNPQTVECPTLSPERQLLWDAADYMEKHGKCEGQWHANGSVCFIGALGGALNGDPAFVNMRPNTQEAELFKAARDLMGSRVPQYDYVWQWSDANDQATVISAMRQAALS